ncbi:ATP synthase subunit delta [Emticicia oligotrophica DSM 17448]|uniref:ATP synthase subunit delta n=1 Tax=Emticicia oligotrophica (strain DSM 17448 / CIP 109782 / MTCC 6937 / GPTSA100-15) TaxID=929562 RepID=A0ABM5N7B2_EMTOG|nr:ATP synthase F1 subunit delta [Emticicia oligotrophica]AFK05432.1 ATP synthase subunit delta [Emticicia oligotrophica DSM 17448]
MADSIVAYRYAKSLFDLAAERKVVDEVNNDMHLFKQICDENRQFLVVLGNPIIRHEQKFGILKKTFEKNVHPVTFSIFSVLTKKNRENLIYSIAEEFGKLYNQQKGIQKAVVTTVTPLTDSQRDEFKKVVAEATGKTVVLEEKVNENLIGGYVLSIGDTQIDTSVRKKLNELKLQLA